MKETELNSVRIFIVLSGCPSVQHVVTFISFVLTAIRTLVYCKIIK